MTRSSIALVMGTLNQMRKPSADFLDVANLFNILNRKHLLGTVHLYKRQLKKKQKNPTLLKMLFFGTVVS